MHFARRVAFSVFASLLQIAACSSDSSPPSTGSTGGASATGGSGGSASPDNPCKFSNCPNEPNPITAATCQLLFEGPCGVQAMAEYKCIHDNDRCLADGRQDGTYVLSMCKDIELAAIGCTADAGTR
jgi:hypothetical protein